MVSPLCCCIKWLLSGAGGCIASLKVCFELLLSLKHKVLNRNKLEYTPIALGVHIPAMDY